MSIYHRVVYLQCLLIYNIVYNNLYPKYLKCYTRLKPAVHYNLRQDATLNGAFSTQKYLKSHFSLWCVTMEQLTSRTRVTMEQLTSRTLLLWNN